MGNCPEEIGEEELLISSWDLNNDKYDERVRESDAKERDIEHKFDNDDVDKFVAQET